MPARCARTAIGATGHSAGQLAGVLSDRGWRRGSLVVGGQIAEAHAENRGTAGWSGIATGDCSD